MTWGGNGVCYGAYTHVDNHDRMSGVSSNASSNAACHARHSENCIAFHYGAFGGVDHLTRLA